MMCSGAFYVVSAEVLAAEKVTNFVSCEMVAGRKDVNTEAEETTALEVVIRRPPFKIQQT
jgi:hypothetical protein